ncbi:MAG: hypothetical protein CMJ18_18195 [Phycisphaeraceae bacterium]|nr:hypothetical protein [Phycisphaeraceae bacterium]
MKKLRSTIDAVARRECRVLIVGESGTGKELVARHVHWRSGRRDGPFVPVECTAIPESLIESQLFGHVKGAFTGANENAPGAFRAADGGTLFLDEIGDVPLHLQAKLLRCIEQSEVVPVGDVMPIPVDARIVTATNRDLGDLVRSGRFRSDLYYRLRVVTIRVPSLRERPGDIGALARHRLEALAARYREPPRSVGPTAASLLEAYHWPGNVRELFNALEHACVLAPRAVIERDDLPDEIRDAPSADDPQPRSLAAGQRDIIARALKQAGGNQSRAARMLHMERHRLHRMIVRYGLQDLT